jgi:hypothetical protein
MKQDAVAARKAIENRKVFGDLERSCCMRRQACFRVNAPLVALPVVSDHGSGAYSFGC